MEKSKLYPQAFFSAEKIEQVLSRIAGAHKNDQANSFYYLTRGDESWRFDNEGEYFAEYRKEHDNSFLKRSYKQFTFKIRYARNNYTDIIVQAATSQEIDSIFEVFEKLYPFSKQVSTATTPSVFTHIDPNNF